MSRALWRALWRGLWRAALSVGLAASSHATVARGQDTAPRAEQHAPGAVFRDCAECPEMVVLPGGAFSMGSPQTEKAWAATHGAQLGWVADEAPQHVVTLRSFALGRYDVTRGEYARFARETGRAPGDGCGHDGSVWKKQPDVDWAHPGFGQSDRDPVVCVSWQDARAYVDWLNTKARQARAASDSAAAGPYRLPTESEWEYAARAGTHTMFWWGADERQADRYAWYAANSGSRTHAAGSKPPNAFGLYDMEGNVWEWTQDCYAPSYAGAPSDGRAVETSNSCLRVDRGGSWFYPRWLLRPAARERNPADYRDIMLGFRVARTLP